MKEYFEAIATANDWVFKYARKDYQNLYSEIEVKDKVHLFVDPARFTKVFERDGVEPIAINYNGVFSMLISSSFDEISYEERYEKYIKPLIDEEIGKIENSLACSSGLTIKRWFGEEAINLFDYNLDGIIVSYEICKDV